MSIISIEGMEFFAYHGCFKEEAIIGTKFRIDLFLKTKNSENQYNLHKHNQDLS